MDSTSRSKLNAGPFLDYCISQFGWTDLSNDTVLDIGCGKHLNLATALLEKFSKVKSVVNIDRNPEIVVHARRLIRRKILKCHVADIEDRDSLEGFEGRINKVISTYTFHHIRKIKEAFRNVHLVLRPGGEAGFLFYIRSGAHEWLTEMLSKPKWKAIYKGEDILDLLPQELSSAKYQTMVLKLGFTIVECHEEIRVTPCASDEICKEALYKLTQKFFNIPSELLDDFKEDAFKTFVKIHGRNRMGKPRFTATELFLLIRKSVTKLRNIRMLKWQHLTRALRRVPVMRSNNKMVVRLPSRR
ncbi:hypothetical protein HNY73_014938 [Argiope bruennichi]|uniref:Methyltransferase domain-containing protein n=1 Tax=Argiope bruennichi TaxID=94029 RepID=A0A8T0EQL0_ARGBR|nr:hypothetical protein HNY73_014938 [Argiope bruennichi]